MAIVACPECGRGVSDRATSCPQCGHPVTPGPESSAPPKLPDPPKSGNDIDPKPQSGKDADLNAMVKLFIGVAVAIALILWAVPSDPVTDSTSTATTARTAAGALDAPTPSAEPPRPGLQWNYLQSADQMSNAVTYQATVTSTNSVDFDFPYQGAQHATLTLRSSPRLGKDIIFQIEKGQILCRSYEDCSVQVRFDEEPAANFSAGGASDNSTEFAFIRNYDRFLAKLVKAKRVRIAVAIYQEGSPVFEFDVSGFDPTKYRPK